MRKAGYLPFTQAVRRGAEIMLMQQSTGLTAAYIISEPSTYALEGSAKGP